MIPEGLSEGESPPPRREPHGGRGEDQTNLACGPPEAPTPAAPKLPGDLSSAPSRCPNLSQPTELKHAAQVREPRASSVRAPPVPYLPHPPGRAAHGGGGREARARDLGSCPPRSRPPWGCSEAPVLTLPKDSSGDQEAEDQTAGGGRLRSHIPPPLGPPTESAPQEGASSPAPRGRAPDAGDRGFSLTHCPLGLWRCTFPSPPPATFHHAVAQLLHLPYDTRPRPLWLLLPAPATLSSRETLE